MSEEGHPILLEDLDSHSIYPLIWLPGTFMTRNVQLFAMPDGTVRWEYVN